MREHFKRHLSRFCKCGKEMYMDSKGWHCPDDKREIKPKCKNMTITKTNQISNKLVDEKEVQVRK